MENMLLVFTCSVGCQENELGCSDRNEKQKNLGNMICLLRPRFSSSSPHISTAKF